MRKSFKILSLLLCFVFVFTTAAPLSVFAEEDITEIIEDIETTTTTTTTKPQIVETTVKGLKDSYNAKADKDLNINLRISPATPKRTVRLQFYDSKKKKYKNIEKIVTEEGNSAKIRFTIPQKYRKKTTGKWRIVINKTKTGKAFKANFKVVTNTLEYLNLNAKTACIYCVDTDQVLYDKGMNKRRHPASTTKVTTAICVIESGKYYKNSKAVAASRRPPAKKLNSKAGDYYRNKDLMCAMLLPSANDAAVMLAWGVSGNGKKFAKLMNETVDKIGLKNTHYTNSFGSPAKDHYTTAYDLCKTVAYAGQFKEFREVVTKRKYSFKSVKYKRSCSVVSADKLHGIKGHIGGKTGLSVQAGACYTGLYQYKGKTYAVTVMGCKNKQIRWVDMKKLYKYIRTYANTKY